MWELEHKESWAPKNWCFWTVVLETFDSPLDCKEIHPVHPKGDQSWIFTGRTDAEVEAPILWPPDAKNWVTGKDRDAGKDWRQEDKGMTEDEMVGRHLWLNGHEFEQALGVGDGQGGLACCSPWVTKSLSWPSDWTVTKLGIYHQVVCTIIPILQRRKLRLRLNNVPCLHAEWQSKNQNPRPSCSKGQLCNHSGFPARRV